MTLKYFIATFLQQQLTDLTKIELNLVNVANTTAITSTYRIFFVIAENL